MSDETNETTAPEPLSRGDHLALNRLLVTFLEAVWKGDEDTAAHAVATLDVREVFPTMGALARIAQQALATNPDAPEAAFIAVLRRMIDDAEAGDR